MATKEVKTSRRRLLSAAQSLLLRALRPMPGTKEWQPFVNRHESKVTEKLAHAVIASSVTLLGVSEDGSNVPKFTLVTAGVDPMILCCTG